MSIFVGIDCGLDGAIAAIGGAEVVFFDTPTLATGKGTRRTYDIPQMIKMLSNPALHEVGCGEGGCIVALETQQSMPGQGVSSTFSIGFGYGIWQGLLIALKMSFELVHPLRWKKAMMPNAPKEKDASVLFASRLFPKSADKLTTERGRALHGRADALLLAEYIRRQSGGTP